MVAKCLLFDREGSARCGRSKIGFGGGFTASDKSLGLDSWWCG